MTESRGRSLEDHLDPAKGPKRILALDGGGVKGILTLGMLEVLEAELRKRAQNPKLVLSDYFDLIGGTSTGAIIAAGLSVGNSVGDLIKMYQVLGPQVFGKTKADGVVIGSRYDSSALKKALLPVLKDKRLGSPEIRTGLALHSKRIDTGSPWVLTNNPRAKYFDPADRKPKDVPNKEYRLVDLVMASAAAPTFFDEVKVPMTYTKNDTPATWGRFVDGAVGGFNNPSVQLLITALLPAYGFGWKPGAADLMMASFGTGARRPRSEPTLIPAGPGMRGINALKAMIYDTQMQGIVLLQALSDPHKGWEINSEIGDMKDQRIFPDKMLDFQRVDVTLDTKPRNPPKPKSGEARARTSIEKLLNRELDHRVLESVDQLANGHPDNMGLLLEIGRKAAPAYVSAKWPNPDFDLKEWPHS